MSLQFCFRMRSRIDYLVLSRLTQYPSVQSKSPLGLLAMMECPPHRPDQSGKPDRTAAFPSSPSANFSHHTHEFLPTGSRPLRFGHWPETGHHWPFIGPDLVYFLLPPPPFFLPPSPFLFHLLYPSRCPNSLSVSNFRLYVFLTQSLSISLSIFFLYTFVQLPVFLSLTL